jgi:hypothetical protein
LYFVSIAKAGRPMIRRRFVPTHRFRWAAVLTISAVLIGLLLRLAVLSHSTAPISTPSPAPTPLASISPAWKVLFPRFRDGKPDKPTDIWVAFADGSDARVLIPDAEGPSWSPDRQRIAFARRGNIWVANADGSAPRQLTFWPDLSPNADSPIHGISWNLKDNLLSFGRSERFAVRRQGDTVETIAEAATVFHVSLKTLPNWKPSNPALPFLRPRDVQPTDFPDKRFAPQYDATESYSLYHFPDNRLPAWSPSGERLLTVRNGDIWLAEAQYDGAPLLGWTGARIAASAVYDGWTGGASHWVVAPSSISWAPDGSYFVYTNTRRNGSGQYDVYVVKRRTVTDENGYSNVVYESNRLPVGASHASVSPDGKWILLSRDRTVFAVTPDGLHQRELFTGGSEAVW